MAGDKFKAVWVSHSSMGDFLKCPRLYYLHNMYKSPIYGRKVMIVAPAMSLGVAVHSVIENLSNYKSDERFSRDLFLDFEEAWKKVSGKIGGFRSDEEENEYKERGRNMIQKVIDNPGPLLNKTIKFYDGDMLPNFFLDEEENIVLCGKVDWVEYLPETNSLRVIDFKTGKYDEKEESLQLSIYKLLLHHFQKRAVTSAAYWYIDRDTNLVEVSLPTDEEIKTKVLDIALKMKRAREENIFECPRGSDGCMHCKPYEKIIDGSAEYVGVGEYKNSLYIV